MRVSVVAGVAFTLAAACRSEPATPGIPLQADVTGCTGTTEQNELIGRHLYSDPAIQNGEYRVTISGAGGGGDMYYASGKAAKWGALAAQNYPPMPQLTEQHDTDGDGAADADECEAHVLPNGVYDIWFSRPGGGVIPFARTIAMLDRHGVAVNIPNSGAFNDVVVSFDLAAVPVTMSGWFGASTAYSDLDEGTPGAANLAWFSTTGPTVESGDTVWFASTYVAQAASADTRPWFDDEAAVLNSYNFDYDRNPEAFGPATNSFLLANNAYPPAHVFAAPGASTTFTVRLRTILPFHHGSSTEPGILVPQAMTLTVTGTPVSFSVSASPTAGQPVTFTAGLMLGWKHFEYYWDFGDGTNSGWSYDYKQVEHTYSSGGSYTVTLRVRNVTGEGPTVPASQTINVVQPPAPLSVTITGPDVITSSGTYTWTALPSGGTPPYTFQWYYMPPSGGEQAVGNKNKYSRAVTYGSPGYFRLRVVVTAGSESLGRIIWVSNGQTSP